jgi:DNA-binding SARP family transcriptional activator
MPNSPHLSRSRARESRLVRPNGDTLGRVVFDRFPFGLLVTDPAGSVVAANAAAGRLLGRTEIAGSTCCELLGCRREDAPLGGECLTELAMRTGDALPDVRMDLQGTDPARALWVTTAPLSEEQVLLQLRPADPRDRRRRTEPHWLSGPALRVTTLGRTSVASAEGPIDGAWLGQRPGQLLKYLVCERGRVSHADQILGRFWPEGGRGAVVNLRHAVFSLRKRLEPARERHAASSFVIARDGGYVLDRRLVHVDADDFEEAAERGLRAHAEGAADRAREALERAAALYRGEFLADEPYAEWAFAERDRLHDLACRVMRALADLRLAADDPTAAVQALARLTELEPFDGEGQRALLGLLISLDRRSEAVRRYRQLRAQWLDAFGEPPDFDVRTISAA